MLLWVSGKGDGKRGKKSVGRGASVTLANDIREALKDVSRRNISVGDRSEIGPGITPAEIPALIARYVPRLRATRSFITFPVTYP